MSDDMPKINIEDDNPTEPSLVDEDSFKATENLIRNLSVKIDEIREKQKELRQRLKNIMENDVALNDLEEQAKQAADGYKKRKRDLMDSVEAKDIKMKMKEVNTEMNEMMESLTNYLLTYFQVTGTQSFSTETGGEREFKLQAKLMPKKED